MTKKPAHLNAEPKELGPQPADLTGKELEPIRDWDQDSIIRGIRSNQSDLARVIEDELNYLLWTVDSEGNKVERPFWHRVASKPYAEVIVAPADLVQTTLAKCRLDNIPVTYQQPWPLLPHVDDEAGF